MKRRYVQVLAVVLLAALLAGCGKAPAEDVTQISSKSLSTTAEVSDYKVEDGTFYAVITVDNAPSLRYLADDAATVSDWKTEFDPYLILADGAQTRLVIGDTTVNLKGEETVVISFGVSAYLYPQDLENASDVSIQLAGFEDEFELHSLQVS